MRSILGVMAVLLAACAFASPTIAQIPGKGGGALGKAPAKTPAHKYDSWRKRWPQSETDDADPKSGPPPIGSLDRSASIRLGQSVKGTLEQRGETATIKFRAPAGTKVTFSLAFIGEVGHSTVSLFDGKRTAVASFLRDGRRFELTDFELASAGDHYVRILHDGKGELRIVMTTQGVAKSVLESTLELSTAGAAQIAFVGFDGLAIRGIEVYPVAPGASIDVRITITDDFDEKVASLEGIGLKPTARKLSLGAPIPIEHDGIHRADVWLVGGPSPQRAVVRLLFEDPPPGVGTVVLTESR